MRAFAAFLMRNLGYAATVAAAFGIFGLKIPPFAILSAAVVGLPALRRGWSVGLLVVVLAVWPVAGAWAWLSSSPGLVFPLVFALWPALLMVAEILRRSGNQGLALVGVGLIVSGCDLAMHVITGDVMTFWREWITRAVSAVPGATFKAFEEEGTLRLINGFLGLMFGLFIMLALLLARWLQSLLYNPGGFGDEFRQLRLPRPVLPLAVAAIWAAGFYQPLLQSDWFMAGMLLFFFEGLATLHGIIALRGYSRVWLVPAYLLLLYAPFALIPGLALLGAVDAFVDFRSVKTLDPGEDA